MERLRGVGYDGGMSILKEYVHPYRPEKSASAVRRCETLSGQQAQLERSLRDQQTYVQFPKELLSCEQQERERKSCETRMKLARLPHRKGLEDFDFSF